MDLVYAAINGGMGLDFKTKQNGFQNKTQDKLADGVLNRLYVKGDFANTNQYSSIKV